MAPIALVELAFFFVVLLFSVIMHEYMHGWVAYRLGDPTARNAGRLTLNPIPHIDPFMTIILPLLLFFSTGYILGGAKPVPVNPLNFRRPRKGMMLVGAAGPATNLALGVGFALFYHLLKLTGLMQPAMEAGLMGAVFINTILAFFNLIPVPPLDGSRIVAGLLPRDAAIVYDRVGRFGLFIVIGLIMFGGFGLILRPAFVYTSWLLGL
jgi:Zn-dependent protease